MKKYKVEILMIAREDIREARRWYNKRQKGLGKRLYEDMRNTIHSIASNPKSFAIRYQDHRLANFNVFPYAAHFYVNDDIRTVYVTGFVHTSMHPGAAKYRL